MKREQLPRRHFLKQVGAVGAGAAALAACGPATMVNPPDGGTVVDNTSDITNLNALLSAEYAVLDAYTQGAGVLTDQKNNGATQADKDLAALVLAVAGEFINDHTAHAALLSSTITTLGGTPVEKATFHFTLPTGFKASTVNVMKLAANEERRAAVAYNGVIKALKQSGNRFIAAAIEGDETQHFTVLRALIEGLAVPTSALTPTTNTDKVVPAAFVSTTMGGPGLQSLPDIATND
jgi:bacterioferritin (cytochrome b1)